MESSSAPNLLNLGHADGSKTVFSLVPLSDGARIRCEHARPAAENDAEALRSSERDWHAILLALQSRLDDPAS